MKGYKGFNKGLICRGKQYAENTIFEEPEANICENGMHFCENPFDVLNYYGFTRSNEFAEVEALDEVKTDDKKKYCTKKLRIGTKLSFAEFIQACVDFVIEKTLVTETGNNISNSGDYVQIGEEGDYAQIGEEGFCSQIGSTGDYAQIGSTGYAAQISNSGDYAQIVSSGNFAQISNSGDYAQIGSTGYAARISSSGNATRIESSGDYARISSSGNAARIESSGENCAICCTGNGSRVKAKRGSWITLTEVKSDEEKEDCGYVCVKTERVDGEHIKEDVFYMLKDGEFQEVGS